MSKGFILLAIGGVVGAIYGVVQVLRKMSILDIGVWIFILGSVFFLSIMLIVVVNSRRGVKY